MSRTQKADRNRHLHIEPLVPRSTANLESSDARLAAIRIVVRGQVQGVGFRPSVYRLASECRLHGVVRNISSGVEIELEGSPDDLAGFQARLPCETPAARIASVEVEPIPVSRRTGFLIEPSTSASQIEACVPHDLATCLECKREIADPANRRYGYPFSSCTVCGPRYSIIESMPFDRPKTAMRLFSMCDVCRAEYKYPADRRFHAQTNACSDCGPRVALWDQHGRVLAGPDGAIDAAGALLRQGRIVAIKGLGGFQLLVSAGDSEAISRLRQRKNRPSKPFAVMVVDLEMADKLAFLDSTERTILASPENPIVLVRAKPTPTLNQIAPRLGVIGLMLPTTPLHHLLLSSIGMPVVATSGNRSEEPIVIDQHEAVERLADIADAFLVHDRPIIRRVDDSVVRVIADRSTTVRLARGYAPMPLPTLNAADCPPILATGGHQKSALAFWNGSQAVLAQHIGDLEHPDTRAAFVAAVQDLRDLYQFDPQVIACDLHPEYFNSRWSSSQYKRVIKVQHHHAHAVSCMVEHDLLDKETLAITWDGTGFGTDGTIWGGEFLRTSSTHFERLATLLPFPLPGGEAAIRHPNRIAFGLLHFLLGDTGLHQADRLIKRLDLSMGECKTLASMIRQRMNTPLTSSIGRLFDAVAALVLGIIEVTYEGEAAIYLEAIADPQIQDGYDLPVLDAHGFPMAVEDQKCLRGDWRPMLTSILTDLNQDVSVSVIAARFHNTLARWAAEMVERFSIPDVVLTGGCFQNRLLTERTCHLLRVKNRRVFTHGKVPPGDGGLAAGQLAVAIARIQDGYEA